MDPIVASPPGGILDHMRTVGPARGATLVRPDDPLPESLWLATLGEDLVARPALPGDRDVDVAIVGAGFTGLWTAYHLVTGRPGIRVAVVEARLAGYGASGRNGGWCSALFPVSPAALARRFGTGPARAMRRALVGAVDAIGVTARAEGIDCQYAKGGSLALARSPAQWRRARAEVAAARAAGLDDPVLLGAAEATARCGASAVLGATYTPHCAALHPARLVRGLARAVERRGVAVYEASPATSIAPGRVDTVRGRVRAEVVVRATEGYGLGLPGQRRALAPVYSMVIATDPLPDPFWDGAGLAGRETFTDHRHLIIYGQRTADGRLAFGGRGAPYHLGSAVRPGFDRAPRTFAALRATLADLFPALRDTPVRYGWGGALGVPRDFMPSVGLTRYPAGALAWAGGYVGDGVATSYLAGRTLADLILGTDSDLVSLPWVDHRSPRWEVEPLRWCGINAGLRLTVLADAEERWTGRESLLGRAFGRLIGH
jgi:glycine/D-amino acid oxidase-like deaminating enzyme